MRALSMRRASAMMSRGDDTRAGRVALADGRPSMALLSGEFDWKSDHDLEPGGIAPRAGLPAAW